jgi:hypothetical protein
MIDLKSCPFCESRAEHYSFNYRKHTVRCTYCLADCGEHDTSERAAFVWNARPNEFVKDKKIEQLTAEVERLKGVIAEIGAMTLTGADDVEDFIFMLCKDTVSDEAIKQAYRKHLKNDIAKMVFGTDTNVPTNADKGSMEG